MSCPFCNKPLTEATHIQGTRDYVLIECAGCPYQYTEVNYTITHYQFTVDDITVYSQVPPIDPKFNTYNTIIFMPDGSIKELQDVITVDNFIGDKAFMLQQINNYLQKPCHETKP